MGKRSQNLYVKEKLLMKLTLLDFASKPGSAMEKETVPGPTLSCSWKRCEYRIVLIAWAVVDVDNNDNWDWFVQHPKAGFESWKSKIHNNNIR